MQTLTNTASNALCPSFSVADQVLTYMKTRKAPIKALWMKAPITMAFTRNCFWVQPEVSPYPSLHSYLVNAGTEPSNVLAVGHKGEPRIEVACYAIKDRLWVGTPAEEDGTSYLMPLIAGLHHPLPLEGAHYIGRVEAAC